MRWRCCWWSTTELGRASPDEPEEPTAARGVPDLQTTIERHHHLHVVVVADAIQERLVPVGDPPKSSRVLPERLPRSWSVWMISAFTSCRGSRNTSFCSLRAAAPSAGFDVRTGTVPEVRSPA